MNIVSFTKKCLFKKCFITVFIFSALFTLNINAVEATTLTTDFDSEDLIYSYNQHFAGVITLQNIVFKSGSYVSVHTSNEGKNTSYSYPANIEVSGRYGQLELIASDGGGEIPGLSSNTPFKSINFPETKNGIFFYPGTIKIDIPGCNGQAFL
jgi:hypothetical protein